MSELFQELYQKATIREHPTILRLTALRSPQSGLGEASSMQARIRLAGCLLDLDDEFDTNLQAVADRMRIRVRRDRYQCPTCGQSQCPGAMQVVQITMKQFMQHLMAGGQGFEYEEL